ncbi:MAG: hypothetical protein JXR42_00515 [Gammaproteobacteria bacterium]|nr:hypothetical protein [Gammaproteobacteria bacterium]
MFEFADTPLSMRKLFLHSLTLYRTIAAKIWYVIFILVGLWGTFSLWGRHSSVVKHYTVMLDQAVKSGKGFDPLFLYTQRANFFGVFSALLFLLTILTISVVIHRGYMLAKNEKNSLVASIALSIKRYITMFLVVFFSIIAVYFGIILLFLPAIFLAVMLLFAPFFVILEQKGIFGAIKESCKLVWGNWWRSFGFTAIFGVGLAMIIALLLYVFNMLFGFVVQGLGLEIIMLVLSSIILSWLYPMFLAAALVLFNDLKLRKG